MTTVYSIGIAALAFSAHAFSESAVWPILHRQPFSIREIGTFLEASRGSVPSTPQALFMARNLDAVIVLLLTTAITSVPFAAAPVVGRVYNRANVTVTYQSELRGGGGIGPYFVQANPAGVLRDRASVLYTSWENQLANKPLPKYRNWFIDRTKMVKRGNFTVEAVRIQQDIECRGWSATANDEVESLGAREYSITFNTSMPTRNYNSGKAAGKLHQHNPFVEVRVKRKLVVWVHDYTFEKGNANKTTATLIFAAIGGDIEGGTTVAMPEDTNSWAFKSRQ